MVDMIESRVECEPINGAREFAGEDQRADDMTCVVVRVEA
jgi:hypothetical protein